MNSKTVRMVAESLGGIVLIVGLILLTLYLSPAESGEKVKIRVGHFPNITHAQAVIGHGLSRKGEGWFEQRLGPEYSLEWFTYNAGPSAMEAIFARTVDFTYVGPNPAINAYIKSKGEDIRIIAGAASGGAAFVVQPDGRIKTDADLKGKKIATPQLGNTQDVAARAYLLSKGYKVTPSGGDVYVIPTQNPDQLALFLKGEVDGVWTVEPWVTRLLVEGKGVIYLEEKDLWKDGKYVTTHLVTSVQFLKDHRDILKKWIAAHIELTQWINQNPDEAKKILNEEIAVETGKSLSPQILEGSFARLELTYNPIRDSLFKAAEDAFKIGFLGKEKPDLSRIYDLSILNEVLREKGLPEIP
ncbi:MAG TPA: aliphatic sulfonate ABC transporter substrate-binding protein [Candidatus Limnocylindrales bacterium]|nr:aliphatic sulfonate ABC transporter substrate-binding protein [Candidatus Limnocylindrales bacterium]